MRIKNFAKAWLCMVLLFLTAGCRASSGMMDMAVHTDAVGAAASEIQALPTVTWKMGSTWGRNNAHFRCDQRFAELVGQLTYGKFTITNYPEGELCAANQLFDYVQEGTLQCGGDWGGYWSGKDCSFELLATTMDNFTGLDYYVWIAQGGGLACYQQIYGQYNMTYFPIMINHAESGIRSSRPITSLEDMRTMKIRLGGILAGRVAQRLGVNIVTMPVSELYDALQRGMIDGGEFSTPSADESLQIQEVAQYWCSPGWHQSAGVNGVMINLDAWNELPELYQKAIQNAAQLCTGEQLTSYIWADAEATEKMLRQGKCIVTELREADYLLIRETCHQVYEEEAASNPNFDMVYGSMLEYHDKADTYRQMLKDYGWGFR